MDHNEQVKKIKEGFIGQKMIVIPPEVHTVISKNMLINNLYLTAIGFYPHANHHDRERKRGSAQYILLYCIKGKGTVHVFGETHVLLPNHYFIIPKNTPHHYHSSATDPWSIYWIHFEGANSDILYARYTNQARPKVHPFPYEQDRIELFNHIFNTIENSFDQRSIELANINLFQFISSLIYHKEIFPSYYNPSSIDKSIQFMKDNLHANLSLQFLADQQNISVSHFSDSFKKNTGNSPIQYFNQLKIYKACQFLYFTDMSIKEICAELGFADPYYFSRLFKNLMKIAPTRYRNNHKNNS